MEKLKNLFKAKADALGTEIKDILKEHGTKKIGEVQLAQAFQGMRGITGMVYEPSLLEHGMKISGRSPDGKFVEIAEVPGHPWYLAVQFHPEFKSKPNRPHPLFASFVEASYRHKTSHATAAGARA